MPLPSVEQFIAALKPGLHSLTKAANLRRAFTGVVTPNATLPLTSSLEPLRAPSGRTASLETSHG